MHAQWLKQVQAVPEVDFQLVLDAVRKEISKKELQVDTTRAKKASLDPRPSFRFYNG